MYFFQDFTACHPQSPAEMRQDDNNYSSFGKPDVFKQYLDGFLVDFEVASAQFLEGSVGILSVHHDNVGTSSGRYHLCGVGEKKFILQVTNSEQHTNAQLQQPGTSGGVPKGAVQVWKEMLVWEAKKASIFWKFTFLVNCNFHNFWKPLKL